jgi:hypothetical protein
MEFMQKDSSFLKYGSSLLVLATVLLGSDAISRPATANEVAPPTALDSSAQKTSAPVTAITVAELTTVSSANKVTALAVNLPPAETLSSPTETVEPVTVTSLQNQPLRLSKAPELAEILSFQADNSSKREDPPTLNISRQAADLQSRPGATVVQPNLPLNTLAQENSGSKSKDEAPPEVGFGSRFTIIPNIGTLGLGIAVATPIASDYNFRLGFNALNYGSISGTYGSLNYDANLNLLNISALVDAYPFGSNSVFYFTAGLIYQNNKLVGTGKTTTTTSFTIGDNTYSTNDVTSVNAEASFPNKIAPYFGIGVGSPVASLNNGGELNVFANLGIMFSGQPTISITPTTSSTISAATSTQLNADVQKEVSKAQTSLSKDVPAVYPVLSIGLSYQF